MAFSAPSRKILLRISSTRSQASSGTHAEGFTRGHRGDRLGQRFAVAGHAAGGSAGFDIYFSTRPAVNAQWEAPASVPGINTADDELDPSVAAGGLLLFFTRHPPATVDANIYWSARRSTTEPWSPAAPLASVNSPSFDSDASLSPDLSYIMFSSTRTGNGEIYERTPCLERGQEGFAFQEPALGPRVRTRLAPRIVWCLSWPHQRSRPSVPVPKLLPVAAGWVPSGPARPHRDAGGDAATPVGFSACG